MKTELEKHIESQLKRIAHLDGFPKHPEGLRDYVSALAVANSPDRAKRVIDAFTGDSELQRCPTAAQIRKVAYDLLDAEVQQQRGCDKCAGTGYLVVYRLITYHGKSYQMKHSEAVAEAEWKALAERIAAEPVGNDRQQVISAARECGCRMRAA